MNPGLTSRSEEFGALVKREGERRENAGMETLARKGQFSYSCHFFTLDDFSLHKKELDKFSAFVYYFFH